MTAIKEIYKDKKPFVSGATYSKTVLKHNKIDKSMRSCTIWSETRYGSTQKCEKKGQEKEGDLDWGSHSE